MIIFVWQYKKLKVTDLGKLLYLDTGTVSPLIRKLKSKGYITLSRDDVDERVQIIEVTSTGMELQDKALQVPSKMMKNTLICLLMD